VEQYLAELEAVLFDAETLFDAAAALARPACDATKYMLDHDFKVGFEEAIEAISA
jgi:hypothetical protein